MFSDKVPSFHHTLVFRLTVWYAGIFTLSSLIAFIVFYLGITSIVRERTDEGLLEDVQELGTLFSSDGIEALERTLVVEADSDGNEEIFFRLLAPDGGQLASSNLSSWKDLITNRLALAQIADGADHVLETITLPGREHQIRTIYGRIGPNVVLQIGLSLEEDDAFTGRFQEIFGATVAAVMFLAALFGWFMAKRALSGVEEVTRTAREISAGDLERRVPVPGNAGEIDRLATTFNQMLDRIQKLVTEITEMNDNIAHDLRSPITRIRGIAEMTLTTGKAIEEFKGAAADTIEECDRLLEMINTMLYISEAEAGAGTLAKDKIEMSDVVRAACELFQPIAEGKGVCLVSDIRNPLRVRGELQKLQRMVANLIDNALHYTPAAGKVTVVVDGNGNQGVIAVTDTGIGISEADLPNIFTRFYRCDDSRSTDGAGLGLSLVKAIVRAHGGAIAVTSTAGVGSTFTVTLPRAVDG